ncbi:unnamed protein product [Bursaphelenchus okinawaensis]|uniref:Uncharacterized protein n=1 Tax=Bursaphelenchus okinawaensis TaxID=465554 RepID=A0A811K7L4_9BILA|nr:unnamed protein product [Bursaphelenchus okinawaensis]CAG9094173.1 unnamed protein product [Bursaphelenchus okinawaensis]
MLMLRLWLMVVVIAMVRSERTLRRMRDLLDESPSQENLLRVCANILSSRNAQFFEENVVLSPSGDEIPLTLVQREVPVKYEMVDPTDRLERIARTLRSSVYAPKLCEPESFYPKVGDQELNCKEICQSCVPGSAAVCHQRNHRFPGVAQTCFCTYDTDRPLHNAVLVLKNGVSQI